MGATLKAIAAEMWSAAQQRGSVQKRLPGGLLLGCRVDGTTRQLGLHRADGAVPFDEAAICRAHFGVPKGIRADVITLAGETWSMYTWETEPAEQLDLFGSMSGSMKDTSK